MQNPAAVLGHWWQALHGHLQHKCFLGRHVDRHGHISMCLRLTRKWQMLLLQFPTWAHQHALEAAQEVSDAAAAIPRANSMLQ